MHGVQAKHTVVHITISNQQGRVHVKRKVGEGCTWGKQQPQSWGMICPQGR
jgi:hypothetical protein